MTPQKRTIAYPIGGNAPLMEGAQIKRFVRDGEIREYQCFDQERHCLGYADAHSDNTVCSEWVTDETYFAGDEEKDCPHVNGTTF